MAIKAPQNLNSKCNAQGFQLIKLREIYSKQQVTSTSTQGVVGVRTPTTPSKRGPTR